MILLFQSIASTAPLPRHKAQDAPQPLAASQRHTRPQDAAQRQRWGTTPMWRDPANDSNMKALRRVS